MLDLVFRWITFVAVGIAVLAGPWLFGAWEMWWFWPFVAVICVGFVATGMRIMVSEFRIPNGGMGDGDLPNSELRLKNQWWALWCLGLCAPFIVYACVRWGMVDVFMTAERAVLLHVTGLLVAIEVVFGVDSKQRRLLFLLLFLNLLLLGLYGVVNQIVWDSVRVLWVPRYPQYAGRAMGSYFCPDHFAGVMEILLCMALAVVSGRGLRAVWKWVSVGAGGLAVAGVIMSHSRGGLLTLGVIFAFAVVWCFAQWPKSMRWYFRMVAIPASLLTLIAMFYFGGRHVERFAAYGGSWGKAGRESVASESVESSVRLAKVEAVWDSLSRTCRGRMFGGATRAWLSAPWFGIGPGMHQNLWPHFAATSDGDREGRVWPTLPNDRIHSYEVHNDWLQLLEEYGVVGVLIFLVPFGFVCFFFVSRIKGEGRDWEMGHEGAGSEICFVYLLSGFLVLMAMSFHSLGDFNLQMPATTWVMAAILGMGFGGEYEQKVTK